MQQKNYSDLLNFIFRIENEHTYSDEEIIEYEEMYKIEVMELLADYCEELTSTDENAQDLEDSILVWYNSNNLVDWFKNHNKNKSHESNTLQNRK